MDNTSSEMAAMLEVAFKGFLDKSLRDAPEQDDSFKDEVKKLQAVYDDVYQLDDIAVIDRQRSRWRLTLYPTPSNICALVSMMQPSKVI